MSSNILTHTFPVTHLKTENSANVPENLKLNTMYRYKSFTFSFHLQEDGTILTECPVLFSLNKDYILLGGIDIKDAYQQLMKAINHEIKKRKVNNKWK